jgi:thiamine biosynthesis lipoprotein
VPLRIVEAGITFDADGDVYPTVVLDVTGRPDVADLARVHDVEGIGDLHTLLEPVPGGLTLHVRLAHPVRAEFSVAFELPAHRALLDLAAAAGHLLLATTAPSEHGANPPWLAVDLDGPRLATLLDLLAPDEGAPGAAADGTDTASPHRFVHQPLLGTVVEVRVGGREGERLAELVDAAVVAELQRLERICSVHDPGSELQRWKAGDVTRPGTDLSSVLAAALDWQVRSGGRFNVQAGLAVQCWRRAEAGATVPDPRELAELAVRMAEPPFTIGPDGVPIAIGDLAGVDLNAFAKGWIVDRAVVAGLDAAHAAGAARDGIELVVNAGGDLRHAGGAAVPVAIENPLRPYDNEPPLTVIALCGAGIATSGRARRGFRIGDTWYGHVIDPRTARPVDTVASISVVAPDAATADVLATVLGVLPPAAAVDEATRYGVACLVVDPEGRVHTNDRWGDLVTGP